MNSKKWLCSSLGIILMMMILIEIFYSFYPYDRHEVDNLVKTRMPKINNENYEILILGDSLARNAFSNIKLNKNILDLTSNASVSLAGNYFILKRYLLKNNKPKHIYMFFIPAQFYENLNSKHTFLFFETVFNKEEEIKEIKEIKELKKILYSNKFSYKKYTESRLNSINFFKHYSADDKAGIKPEEVNEEKLNQFKRENFINNKIKGKINSARAHKDEIKIIPKIYINKIKDMSDDMDIKLTIVIEPSPLVVNDIFKRSEIYKYILEKDIELLNINDYYEFNNYFFYSDGSHISGKVNEYYQNLIDKNILNIY